MLRHNLPERQRLRSGGLKWISENSKIQYCKNEKQFELLKKNQLRLKYQKEPDEYGVVSKLIVKTSPNHNPNYVPQVTLQKRSDLPKKLDCKQFVCFYHSAPQSYHNSFHQRIENVELPAQHQVIQKQPFGASLVWIGFVEN